MQGKKEFEGRPERVAIANSSMLSLTISSISKEIVRSAVSPRAVVLTLHCFANQQAAFFIPMPNSHNPLRSGGISAGRNALMYSDS